MRTASTPESSHDCFWHHVRVAKQHCFAAGNFKEETSFLGGRHPQRPRAAPRIRFNPNFKFGAAEDDAIDFRLTLGLPGLSVRTSSTEQLG